MSRVLKYNGLVAIGFLILWILLAVIEVKIQPFWFLKYIFFASIPLIFLAFFLANWRGMDGQTKHPAITGLMVGVVLSVVFVVIAIVVVTNFKLLIGGHL
jgi:hypothetical protein